MTRFAFAIVPALLFAPVVHAQSVQPELRVDVLGPEPYSVQPGIGTTIRLGNYARVTTAVGYAVKENAALIEDRWRGDLLARVTLDPFREHRWAFSIGGGLSFRRRTFLAAIVDLEGPEIAGMMPALQLGVSGGFRGALVLRRAIKERR